MHNLSISDLNSIQFDEKFTGQLLVNAENGRIVRNYHLPDGAIAGSVEALLELAERARLIKPSTSHHDDDLHFTGRMVSHYENGVEVSRERLRDDRFNSLKREFDGAPEDAAGALLSVADMMKAAYFLINTSGYKSEGEMILSIASDYAEYVAETRYRRKFTEDVSHA